MSHGVKVIVPQTPVFPGIPVVGFTPASGVSAAGTFTDGQTVFLQFNSTAFTSKADARPLYMLPFQTNLTTDPTFSRTAQTMVDPGNGNTQIQSAITPTNAAGACQFIPTTTSGGTSTAFLNSPHFAVTGGAGYRIYANIEYYNGMSAMPQNDKMWRLWPASGVGGTNTPDVYHAFSGGNNEYITDNENVINATGLNANGHFMPLPKNVGVWEIREHFWKENTYGLIDGVNNMAINSQLGIPPGALWGPCNINNAGALNPAGAGPMNKLYLDQFSVANPPNFTTDKGIYGCIWIDDDDCQLLATDEGSTLQLALANFGATNFKRVPQVQLVRTVNGSTVNLQVVVRRGSHAALGGKNLLLKSSHFAAINLGVFTTPVVVTTSSLPSATQGVAYSQSLAASGGTAPYTYTLVTATPNSGGWINVSSAGVVTGTPGTAETETITVFATDSLGATSVNQPVSLTVAAVGAAFDFYISPTGSDSNTGTLASPWAITALNTKQATYGGLGKRIGVIGGASSAAPVTYNVQALAASRGSGGAGYLIAALSVDGGSAANGSTYLAPCNSSGSYVRGAVILSQFSGGVWGNPNDNTGGGGRAGNPTLGHKSDVAHRGYLTIDGFVLDGNISAAIQVGQFGDGITYSNILIENNEVRNNNGQGSQAGDNLCGIDMAGSCVGHILQNNWIHDCIGYATGSLDHLSAFLQWQPGLLGTYRFNTCTNAGGIFGKESTQSGNTVCYNAVDVSMFTGAASAIQDFCQGDASHLIQFYGNVLKGQQGMNLLQTLNNSGVNVAPINCFGNTIDIVGSAGDTMGICVITSGAQSNYNNIINNSLSGNAGEGLQSVRTTALTVLDYNGYFAASLNWHVWPGGGGGSTNYTTIAAWRTGTGKEANSIAPGAPALALFTGGSGTLPSKYDLQSSSPCKAAGRVGGVSTGAVIDMGAWGQARSDTSGNPGAQIGCNFAS